MKKEAKKQFEAKKTSIAIKVAKIKGELEKRSENAGWGDVGDAGHVEEELASILAFLGIE